MNLILLTDEKVLEVETSMANKKTSYEALTVVPTKRTNQNIKCSLQTKMFQNFFISVLFLRNEIKHMRFHEFLHEKKL